MEDERLKKYEVIVKDITNAKNWNNLPNGKKYQNDKMWISVDHCTAPILVRIGQQYARGNNYWATDGAFNKAILRYLVHNWDEIYPKIIAIMDEDRISAIKELKSYVQTLNDIVSEIN